jgi:hypothetical protein
MREVGAQLKRKRAEDEGETETDVEKNTKTIKVDNALMTILKKIQIMGEKAKYLINIAAKKKPGKEGEILESEIQELNINMLDIAKSILNYIKQQTISFVKNNGWLLLTAAFIGIGLSCVFLLPGVAAGAEFLAMVGVSGAKATAIAGTIIGTAGTFALFKIAFKLYEKFGNHIMDKHLVLPTHNEAITDKTKELADKFLGFSNTNTNSYGK